MNDDELLMTDDSPMVSAAVMQEIEELYRVGKIVEAKQRFINAIRERGTRLSTEAPNEPQQL